MKKLILAIGILIISLNIQAQSYCPCSFLIVRDSICMKSGGSIDSCVTVIFSDTLVNTSWVRTYVAENVGLIEFDYIDFDTTIVTPDHRKARIYYDTLQGAFVAMANDSESTTILGSELIVYGRNATSSNLTLGEVVYIDSSGVDPYPVFRRAIADNPDIASATIGVASHIIEPGTLGYLTRFGGVDMDVSGFDENAILYVSPSDSGELVSYAPRMPFYKIRVGRVIQPGNPGILGVDVEPFTGNDTEVALDGVLNGIILDKQSLRDTIISNVLYFETNNETNDTIDLPFMYLNEIYLLNTTSGAGKDGRAQVALTYGTATSALTNYIYIDNSGTPTLTANTTGFPVDGVRLGECGVFAQDTHSVYGFAYFQRFNNSINASTTDGLLNRSVKRQRQDGSKWESGVDPTVSIITNGAAVDSLKVETTSGIIWQFNSQTFQSQDGKRYLWLNSPTGERWIGHLGEIDSTSDGIDLHGGNNRRYGLNIFAIQNSGDFDDFLAVNAPLNYYNTDESSIQDVANYAVTTVPSKYGKVTARLFRVVVNYETGGSGTLTNLLGSGGYQDERGQLLGTGGGGGGSGGAITDFSDAEFTVFNSADPTKLMDFDLSSITTGNTRTIIMADEDIDLYNTLDASGTVWNGTYLSKTNATASPFFTVVTTSTGVGFQVTNSSTANGFRANNNSSGWGFYCSNPSTGTGMEINGTSTGKSFVVSDNGTPEVTIDTSVTVFKDSVSFEDVITIGGGASIDSSMTFEDAIYNADLDSIVADTIHAENELFVRDTTIIELIETHGGNGTPAGSSGDIQYNNSGSFGGAPMTTDGSDIAIENNLVIYDQVNSDSTYLYREDDIFYIKNEDEIRMLCSTGSFLITSGNLSSTSTEFEFTNVSISTPFDEETYASSLTIDFSERSFKKVDLTGNITINISNLPEGVSTLVINQDGTGRTITIGTGWGTVADSQPSLSTTADAKNIVQFIYDGDDTTYCVVTEGN